MPACFLQSSEAAEAWVRGGAFPAPACSLVWGPPTFPYPTRLVFRRIRGKFPVDLQIFFSKAQPPFLEQVLTLTSFLSLNTCSCDQSFALLCTLARLHVSDWLLFCMGLSLNSKPSPTGWEITIKQLFTGFSPGARPWWRSRGGGNT